MAVLPLLRWNAFRLDATSLVIGSMAPDFEYFAHGEQAGSFSHTFLGLGVFCVPATLMIGALWYILVRGPIYAIAPISLRSRLDPGPWRDRWDLWAVLSCLAGAAVGSLTHLLWDGFTHAKGQVTEHVHQLKHPIEVPGVGTVVLHRVLQYASTLVGLIVLTIVIARALKRRTPVDLPSVSRLGPRLVFLVCIAAGVAVLVARVVGKHLTDPGDLVVGAISGGLAGTIVASIIVRLAFARTLAAVG